MKKGRSSVTIMSHRMLRTSGIADNGKQTQANSFGPCLKHFFSMEEGTGATQINDIVGGMVVSGITSQADGWDADIAQRLYQSGSKATTGSWTAPGSADVLIVSSGRMRFDTGISTHYGGAINLYMGAVSAGGQLKVQPTHAVFSSSQAGGDTRPHGISTRYATEYADRGNNDVNLVVAACKRGSTLEHYHNDTKTGTITLDKGAGSRWNSDLITAWDSFTPGNVIWFSHGPYGLDMVTCNPNTGLANAAGGDIACTSTPLGAGGYIRPNGHVECPSLFTGATGGVAEYAQDYTGFAVFHFADGAPDDIGEAIVWMRDQWASGNKVIWPGWSTLS